MFSPSLLPSKNCGSANNENLLFFSMATSSGDLPLLLPGGAEADIDDEENADIQAEGYLGSQVGPSGGVVTGNSAFGFDSDGYRHQAAQQISVALEQQECGDVELRRIDVHLNADHVEHADVSHHRQADRDLRPEAELHVQRRALQGIGGNVELCLADCVYRGSVERHAHHRKFSGEAEIGACGGQKLFRI